MVLMAITTVLIGMFSIAAVSLDVTNSGAMSFTSFKMIVGQQTDPTYFHEAKDNDARPFRPGDNSNDEVGTRHSTTMLLLFCGRGKTPSSTSVVCCWPVLAAVMEE